MSKITMDAIVEIECTLDNKCLTANIVFNAKVSAPSKPDKKNFGIAETAFKDRFRNHTKDFTTKIILTTLNSVNTCEN